MSTITFHSAPECPECGAKEQVVDVVVRSRGFRLGPWEFQLWTWGKDICCLDCNTARDGHERAIEDAYEAGQNDAYKEMYQRSEGE